MTFTDTLILSYAIEAMLRKIFICVCRVKYLVCSLQYLRKDLHFGYWVKSMLDFNKWIIMNYSIYILFQSSGGTQSYEKKAKIVELKVTILQSIPVNIFFFFGNRRWEVRKRLVKILFRYNISAVPLSTCTHVYNRNWYKELSNFPFSF